MTTIQIVQFDTEQPVDSGIRQVLKTFDKTERSQKFVIGTQVQDERAVQITSEWDAFRTQGSKDLNQNLTPGATQKILGDSTSIFHVALNESAFGPGGPVTANVVEYAQSWFPSSQVTLDFQRQIEEDFSKFDAIFVQESKGHHGLAYGWVIEEQEHKDVDGGRAKCFLIVRGWNSMADFQRSVETDAYRKAIPILFGWGAPFKMWHVERRN